MPSSSSKLPSIRPDYNYQWQRDNDVPELIIALATRMKLSLELILKEGVDTEMLFLALLRLYKDWFNESHKQDLELQALLSVAAACQWLYEGQQDKLNDLLEMLDEVQGYGGGNEVYGESLTTQFTREGASRAIERSLGATVQSCTLEPDLLEISFLHGNYGEGPFDGIVCIDEYEGLYLLNHTTKDRQDFQGTELPRNDSELEEALTSDLWKSPFQQRRTDEPSHYDDPTPPQQRNSDSYYSLHNRYYNNNPLRTSYVCDDREFINDTVCYSFKPPRQTPSSSAPMMTRPSQSNNNNNNTSSMTRGTRPFRD